MAPAGPGDADLILAFGDDADDVEHASRALVIRPEHEVGSTAGILKRPAGRECWQPRHLVDVDAATDARVP